MAANYVPVQDPWEAAANPANTQEFWGEINIDVWFCALAKGTGRVPYDPNQMTPDGKTPRRYTAIEMKLIPLAQTNLTNPVERSMLAEFGEWVDIVLPSLRALNLTKLQELNKKFAHVEMVKTGKKYNKTDEATGETKSRDLTTFKFLGIFNTEAECVAAYTGGNSTPGTGQAAPAAPFDTTPANGNGNGPEKEKEAARQFLKVLVSNAARAAGKDIEKMRTELAPLIASQPFIAKFFTVDSPETAELMLASL
jgi:hypothetical protein